MEAISDLSGLRSAYQSSLGVRSLPIEGKVVRCANSLDSHQKMNNPRATTIIIHKISWWGKRTIGNWRKSAFGQ
jgi:hypothetical protein